MNLYFDTEFTGLVPGTTLISLGIVSENGDKFYAEFTDYDESKVTPWIEENVISNLAAKKEVKPIEHRQRRLWMSIPPMYEESWAYTDLHEELMNDSSVEYYCGSTNYIREKLLEWIKWHANELKGKESQRVQFVSDVCHYDFYLLQNQVFGGAFEMPEYINPVCYDICQDINCLSCMGVGNNFNTTENMYNAFDISREKLVEDALLELPKGRKHNALYDAEVIKLLYEYYYNKKMETIENFRAHKGWCRDTFDSWFEDPEYVSAVDFTQEMSRYINTDALEVVGFTDQEGSFSDGVQWLLEYIDGLPSADVQPVRHGRWETDGMPMDDGVYFITRCTACGMPYEYGHNENYCGFCGARMDGEQDDRTYQ